MNLDPTFLAILACPVCRGKLRASEPAGEFEEELICDSCGKAYPVADGIPDLLPDSGRSLGEDA